MKEAQRFSPFVPANTKYVLLGSFNANPVSNDNTYDWYYGSKRNQFWKIIEAVYGVELHTTGEKKQLFSDLRLAVADLILQCERKHGNSADTNLVNCEFNYTPIQEIFAGHNIERVFFSSRFVEGLFHKHFTKIIQQFPRITFHTLPSPSPRYARLSLSEKVDIYKTLLPPTIRTS